MAIVTLIEYICIPSGAPPAVLASGDDEDILEWCKACRAPFEGRLTNEALRYWVRYFAQSYTPEYKRIGERIDVLVRDVAPKTFLNVPENGETKGPSEG